jgi:hypothetical protein
MEWESRRLESLIRSWRGLETGWFVEIVKWRLKLRCIAQFKEIFRPEDGLPASIKKCWYNIDLYSFDPYWRNHHNS